MLNFIYRRIFNFILLLFLSFSTMIAVSFATEPTMNFFVENTLQSQYEEINSFKKLYDALNKRKKISLTELKYINQKLSNLLESRRDFILKDETKLLLAESFEKLGNRKKAMTIYQELIDTSDDKLVKTDALLKLLEYYSKVDINRAILLAERHFAYIKNYRKNEFYSLLFKIYYLAGRGNSARKIALEFYPADNALSLYSEIVWSNWQRYSRSEKRKILSNLFDGNVYDLYTKLAILYITEYKPDSEEVEEIGANIIDNCDKNTVKYFLTKLKKMPEYSELYQELDTYNNPLSSEIYSHSATLNGQYYYKKLRHFNRKGRYNYEKTVSYYESYLKTSIEPVYAKKNLSIVIRNLLAYKKYDMLIKLVRMTEEKLGYTNEWQYISEYVSFWTGYSYYMIDEKTNSILYFEKTISAIPDGYYALHARNYLSKVLEELNINLYNYIKSIRDKFKSEEKSYKKLYYGRLLFGIDSNKSKWKREVVEIYRNYGKSALFDYDEDIPGDLKINTMAYFKFLIYVRAGITDKAEAILEENRITEKTLKDILILKELLKSRNFGLARQYFERLGDTDFINENFAFFSKKLQLLLYPTPYDSEIEVALSKLEETNLDRYLIYAVIRGESMYIPKSRSRAGARGLMQLLPSTARFVSRKANLKENHNLYDPLDNIILGTIYLDEVIRDNGLLKGLASYNGGLWAITKTQRNFYPENVLELLEIHPARETRGYVKKVLTNYLRYKSLYEGENFILTLDFPKEENKSL